MATARDKLLPEGPPENARGLYERDFYSWALEQAEHLRARRFDRLDLDNLIEEVEDLAGRHADTLESRYRTLLAHMLKWQFQPDKRTRSWKGTIIRERGDIPDHLAKHPGLKPRRQELFADAYRGARRDAMVETGLPVEHFPAENPYTLEQAMDPEFWPGGQDMPAKVPGKRRRR